MQVAAIPLVRRPRALTRPKGRERHGKTAAQCESTRLGPRCHRARRDYAAFLCEMLKSKSSLQMAAENPAAPDCWRRAPAELAAADPFDPW